jgi:hypothetical protein
MAQKIDQLEAEAEAGSELAGELGGDTLDQKFAQLEASGAGTADMALAELKAKMGMLPAASTPTAGQLPEKGGSSAGKAPSPTAAAGASSLSAEDLKELEELNLGDDASKS